MGIRHRASALGTVEWHLDNCLRPPNTHIHNNSLHLKNFTNLKETKIYSCIKKTRKAIFTWPSSFVPEKQCWKYS